MLFTSRGAFRASLANALGDIKWRAGDCLNSHSIECSSLETKLSPIMSMLAVFAKSFSIIVSGNESTKVLIFIKKRRENGDKINFQLFSSVDERGRKRCSRACAVVGWKWARPCNGIVRLPLPTNSLRSFAETIFVFLTYARKTSY